MSGGQVSGGQVAVEVAAQRGQRDAAAGIAPGQTRDVTLVAVAGKRTIYGFRQDIMGKL